MVDVHRPLVVPGRLAEHHVHVPQRRRVDAGLGGGCLLAGITAPLRMNRAAALQQHELSLHGLVVVAPQLTHAVEAQPLGAYL